MALSAFSKQRVKRRGMEKKNGYELVKFFFLLMFSAAVPAIVSGGVAHKIGATQEMEAAWSASYR